MRLFIAINFNKEIKDQITAVQYKLKQHSCGSYTHPENIHLTLVFLGEISSEKLENIKQVINKVIVPHINIQFSHIGFFKRNDGDIWWIGLHKNNKLIKLHKDLCYTLNEYGFIVENRAYKPHITLGRRIHFNNSIDKNTLLDKPFETEVNSISLIKSERINGNLIYTEIFKHP